LAGEGTVRTFTDLLRLGARRPAPEVASAPPAALDPVHPSMALGKFLSALAGRQNPGLIDLGPVVGSNITFFGERLGCKIFVEDLFAEIERVARAGTRDRFLDFIDERFRDREATVDGVLCWDVFDYLDRRAAQRLAQHLVRMLRPGGAVLGFFGTVERHDPHFTKFVIVDDRHLRHRLYPAADSRRHVFVNRDIIKMFEGLDVSEQFLLKSNTREILLRKA